MADIDGAQIKITSDSSQAIQELNKLIDALNRLQQAKSDFKVDVKLDADTTDGLNNIQTKIAQAGEKAGETFKLSFSQKFVAVSEIFTGLTNKIERAFANLSKIVIAKITSIMSSISLLTKRSLAVGGGFESQMTSVKVISGATEEELDALTKKAREMGATLPITAKDAAMAMTSLAQRGTEAKDILASVTDVANLAISQGVSMGRAADLLGSTMTNFGIAIEDANKVTNIFNNISNQSAMNISKLELALKYVGPAANAVGMPLTEAAAAMGVLANSGLTGEMIGTGLAGVLSKLASSSQILGIRTKNLDGSMRPLKEIFSALSLRGFSLAEATEIFGQRGNKAALALAKYSGTLEQSEKNLQNWGATQYAVNEQSKTFTNTMQALSSAIEEFHIEVFEQIKNQSKDAVAGVTELLRAFNKWIEETKIAEKVLNALLQGFELKIPSGEEFKKLLDNFNIENFVDSVRRFGESLKGIGESIVKMFGLIKAPLNFLIQHLDTFGTISFWGWILGKGIQVPAAIISIAASFIQLKNAISGLVALSVPFSLFLGVLTVDFIQGGKYYDKVTEQIEKFTNKFEREITTAKEKAANIFNTSDLLSPQRQSDRTAAYELDIKVKTGFEEIPKSYQEASKEMKENLNEDVKFMQNVFKEKIFTAWQEIYSQLPNTLEGKGATTWMSSAKSINNALASQISRVLQGSQKDWEELPEIWQKVAEKLNATGVAAGQAQKNVSGLLKMWREMKEINEKYGVNTEKSEFQTFSEDISNNLKALLEELPERIERSKNFLKGGNLDLVVDVSLSQAQKKLAEFSKSASEKYSVSEEIISTRVFERLNELAKQGNITAQSLVNAWQGSTKSLDDFLQSAYDAVNYLGESPQKFTPALNLLTRGIQKIDPLTGKVTESFKHAHDALKKWADTNFDNLLGRIQKLKKAVAGGFLDESALKNEWANFSKQLKLQIVAELEPMKNQFGSQKVYEGVVASEYFSRINDLGIDAFKKYAAEEMKGFAKQTKSVNQMIDKFIVDGKDMTEKFRQLANANNQTVGQKILQDVGAEKNRLGIQDISQAVTTGINPLISKIEQFNSQQNNTRSLTSAIAGMQNSIADKSSRTLTNIDYTANIVQVVQAINSLSTDIKDVKGAVNSVEEAVKSQSQNENSGGENNYSFDANNIAQAITTGITPMFTRMEQNSYNLASLQQSIDALKSSTDNNVSALSQSQNSGGQDFSAALSPLLAAVQNLSTAMNIIQGNSQNNMTAINDVNNAVRSVESVIKNLSAGNTYNIEINQQGFAIEKKSDADYLARSTVSALRSGFGNGGV